MPTVKPAILVTDGAGYIGSHAVLALKHAGYKVVVLDNLVHAHSGIVEQVLNVELVIGKICDRNLLAHLFKRHYIKVRKTAMSHNLGNSSR